MDLGLADRKPDPEEDPMVPKDDGRDLVDDKLCRARMNSLTDSVKELQGKVDWANRFIILTLVGVIGELLVMLREYNL